MPRIAPAPSTASALNGARSPTSPPVAPGLVIGGSPLVAQTPANLASFNPQTFGEFKIPASVPPNVRLSANESPYGYCQSARVAQANAALSGLDGSYTDINPLLDQLAQSTGVDRDGIVLATGSNALLKHIPASFKGVFICSPTAYLFGPREAQLAHKDVIKVGNLPEYQENLDGMLEAAEKAHDGSIVYFANPANPTGNFIEPDAVGNFLERLPKNALALVDLAYEELIPKESRFDVAGFLKKNPDANVIFIRTLSKAHGFAGGRVGYALTSKPIAEILRKANPPQLAVSASTAAAAIEILRNEHHCEIVALSIARGRKILCDRLDDYEIKYIPAHANFVTALFTDADQAAAVRDALSKRGFDTLHLKGGYPNDLANAVRITIGHVQDRGRFLQALDESLQEVLKRKPVPAPLVAKL